MHISLEFLKPTDCSFHGIVPGSANYPLGWIALDVYFGNRCNFRREKLEFKDMDLPSQYDANLGWPTFLCFMALPHYTYLVLKMLGPNGLITIKGSFKLPISATRNSTRWCKHLTKQQNMEDQRSKRSATHHLPQVDLRQTKLSTTHRKQRKFGSLQRTRTILHQTILGLLSPRQNYLKAFQPEIFELVELGYSAISYRVKVFWTQHTCQRSGSLGYSHMYLYIQHTNKR
jgi:hypothetical protein